ncbi:hypothetical protein KKG71_02730 [Patescibacteria group bacterium]|nr:hypothetical protein [Patescibacteria group bacterium]
MNELEEKYSKLSDNELLIMVYFESSDYTEEAIKIAKSILDKKGLSQPTDEILQHAKNHQTRIKKSEETSRDIFGEKKLKQAVQKRDYYFIGKWLFWIVVGSGIYSALTGIKEATYIHPLWSPWMLFFLEIFLTIAIFGIIPIVFFIAYSLRLSSGQRKEKGLFLFMPKYVLFVYGISLLLFVVFLILPRL